MRLGTTTTVGIVAVLAIAGTAVGQQGQIVTASVTGETTEQPETLPGVYEAELLVEVEASGGHCSCEETTVRPRAWHARAGTITFEPASFTIDWAMEAAEGEIGRQTRQVNVSIPVPSGEDRSSVTVEIDAEMDHRPGRHIESQTNPAAIELPLPEPNATGQGLGDPSADDAGSPSDGSGEEAATTPGATAAAAGLAGLAAALVRRRA